MFQTCHWTHNTTSEGFILVHVRIQPLDYSGTLLAHIEQNTNVQENDTRHTTAVLGEEHLLCCTGITERYLWLPKAGMHRANLLQALPARPDGQASDWCAKTLTKNWVRPVEQKPMQSWTVTHVKIFASTEQLGRTGKIRCLDYLLHNYYHQAKRQLHQTPMPSVNLWLADFLFVCLFETHLPAASERSSKVRIPLLFLERQFCRMWSCQEHFVSEANKIYN